MTLLDVVNKIKDSAKTMPNINTIYEGSVYDLNALPNVRYNAIVITQGHHTIDENFAYYNFKIFYVDRKLDEDTRLSKQSNAITILHNIVNKTGLDFDDLKVTTFEHKFKDDCVGAWVDVTFGVNNELGLCNY